MKVGVPQFRFNPVEKKPVRKGFTKHQRKKIWQKYIGNDIHGQCFCCSGGIDAFSFQMGHIMAHAEGGSERLFNIRPLCECCNDKMGTMNLFDYKASLFPKQDYKIKNFFGDFRIINHESNSSPEIAAGISFQVIKYQVYSYNWKIEIKLLNKFLAEQERITWEKDQFQHDNPCIGLHQEYQHIDTAMRVYPSLFPDKNIESIGDGIYMRIDINALITYIEAKTRFRFV